ncbi:MAG: 50S ribosomal protein L9 [Verrucomicrobia bacterium CG_4_10_14_3_um_filter_43_23]|nr:MAG: 50S ribosomal protein L9 [Verrucomicrobia bacterium CG1_02_43_26]PIP59340.1 MAG: 50S ribosomal protein L9 [Verrucomicrobia bacterium CG22_combo_CG10-13_8_21_14_all_43_17]PIX57965.1 MAG: 50S ribosomal protein L9 [Verrucomicrobia bacterium CG_4_10_14_3_um_filter_43_23]PIY62833.1 MAG: 50S ribosomal protein L9 [Verrucomicrobia bacterium CG_4_10_14_0_8_um_filter_43_34]PJA44708.1 MAG: 50S ribosomal protein L9 [Verrucomicrobia bacterium CG_4_9_14_3_um_filter_43_20]
MAKSEVLLIAPVERLGHEGDVVSVALGYARNCLIPQNKAIPVTHANKKRIDALIKAREDRLSKELQDAKEIGGKIEKLSFAIAVKTGENGKMFGAVTTTMLLDKIAEAGIEINKKALSLPNPIKNLGQHVARVKLHHDVAVELKFEVVSENPIEG